MSLTRQSSLFTAAQDMDNKGDLKPVLFLGVLGAATALSLSLLWLSSTKKDEPPVDAPEVTQNRAVPEITP